MHAPGREPAQLAAEQHDQHQPEPEGGQGIEDQPHPLDQWSRARPGPDGHDHGRGQRQQQVKDVGGHGQQQGGGQASAMMSATGRCWLRLVPKSPRSEAAQPVQVLLGQGLVQTQSAGA